MLGAKFFMLVLFFEIIIFPTLMDCGASQHKINLTDAWEECD